MVFKKPSYPNEDFGGLSMANMYVDPEQPGEDLPLSPNPDETPGQVPPVPPAAPDPDQTLYHGDTWVAEPQAGIPDANIPVEFANEPAPEAAGQPPVEPVPPAAAEREQAPLPPPPPPYQPAPPQP